MAVTVDTGECIGCGNCEDACPADALKVVDGKALVNANACVDCGTCIDECPVEAISA